jgi:urease accessory protein
MSNHVANRASSVQGRTFLGTCEKAFSLQFFSEEVDGVNGVDGFHFHYAPIFGVVMKKLSIEKSLMQKAFFHIALRGMLSASVRLGLVGPYQGQQIQTRLSITM